MAEAKTEEQWARGHKILYNKFLNARSAKFPPRDHSLTLSEWFQILHKDTWAPFVQKEIKMIRYFQMFNDYRYLNNLPEIQLGQFRQAIRNLGSHGAHTEAIKLADLNASQAKINKPPVSTADFLDMNSIHLVRDPFAIWVERYKDYVAMRLELKQKQLFYPISIDQFFQHASFGTICLLKMSLGQNAYGPFLSDQRQLHILRMVPVMGPSYSIDFGAFQAHFEEQECQAWPIITRHASLLSPAHYLPNNDLLSQRFDK
ncbi:hypothetical protein Taro_042766 [Colocasia esculenta]|uniref:Uncharacterized protein n=1 Tax=Colocasia esculenta TaxID=4460 RepID=A0A843WZ88_COLES|nr:hypothetical protein [Colocasia esculenta]